MTHESQCFAGQRVPFGTSITHWFILLNHMHTRLLQPPLILGQNVLFMAGKELSPKRVDFFVTKKKKSKKVPKRL